MMASNNEESVHQLFDCKRLWSAEISRQQLEKNVKNARVLLMNVGDIIGYCGSVNTILGCIYIYAHSTEESTLSWCEYTPTE